MNHSVSGMLNSELNFMYFLLLYTSILPHFRAKCRTFLCVHLTAIAAGYWFKFKFHIKKKT